MTVLKYAKRKQYTPLPKGTEIGEYTISDIVGLGGFGALYSATAPHLADPVALKLEIKSDKSNIIHREIQVHSAVNGNPYFPLLYEVIELEDMTFISMELLGPNLSSMKNRVPGKKFMMPCIVKIAIETLKSIQVMHSFGFLHRDIKPGNFLVRDSKSHPITLIDFGLSRPYMLENRQIPPRNRPGFVGTAAYASLNAHMGKELGRRDDLISWFFTMMKLMKKDLPWPRGQDKKVIRAAKLQFQPEAYFNGLPSQWIMIYTYILQLHRADEPNYNLIYSFLLQMLDELGASIDEPFAWEKLSSKKKKKIFKCSTYKDFEVQRLENLPEPVLPDAPRAVSVGDSKDPTASLEEPNCLPECLLM